MGQSLAANYLHIVFSTKRRHPWIIPEVEQSLFAYIGGICRGLKCPAIAVGGYRNHVHLLVRLHPTVPLARLLERCKSKSSRWVKGLHPSCQGFQWQNGYGAFSVEYHRVEQLRQYILNQRIHHQFKRYEEEYIELLEKEALEWDDRYVWD